jgi:hypothetical protein
MKIIIDINGIEGDNETLLKQIEAANGWNGMDPKAIAQKYSETLATQIVQLAQRGKNAIEQRAKEEEVTTLAAKTVFVSFEL